MATYESWPGGVATSWTTFPPYSVPAVEKPWATTTYSPTPCCKTCHQALLLLGTRKVKTEKGKQRVECVGCPNCGTYRDLVPEGEKS